MATHNIAVLPGDGIGSEVIAEAVKVLERVEVLSAGEIAFQLEWLDAGADIWRRTGIALSDDVFVACRDADAVLIGAMGLPDVRHPDGREAGTDATFRLR